MTAVKPINEKCSRAVIKSTGSFLPLVFLTIQFSHRIICLADINAAKVS